MRYRPTQATTASSRSKPSYSNDLWMKIRSVISERAGISAWIRHKKQVVCSSIPDLIWEGIWSANVFLHHKDNIGKFLTTSIAEIKIHKDSLIRTIWCFGKNIMNNLNIWAYKALGHRCKCFQRGLYVGLSVQLGGWVADWLTNRPPSWAESQSNPIRPVLGVYEVPE